MSKKAPAPTPETLRIDYLPLHDLKRANINPKLHALDVLGQSFKRFGYVAPVILDDSTGQLVAGHGRLSELELLKATGHPPPARIKVDASGEWLVPVVRGVAFADPREAEAYLMADNRLVELGGWDQTQVDAVLKDLASSGLDNPLAGTGFALQIEQSLKELGGIMESISTVTGEAPPEDPPSHTSRMLECPACNHKWDPK